ncbi:MAG: beta-galactosidase [Eubacteriales bacterium]|nr:beta-galactosidase [Eubacteriales bacterium]
MRYILNDQSLVLGVCYYPEHWPRSAWAGDLRRMTEAGIRVIRIAEFAWNKFEPEEGRYIFAFFDDFLEEVEKTPIKVIFCTPTATPPAWLTHKYPEVLNARMDGVLYRHGSRRHYNYNSPVYQEFSRKIVEQFGAHYAAHPSIIGWQIDNELNCETSDFYSESDSAAFRRFLEEKYGSLEALNEAWGTVFWNQTYTAWEEIFVPQTTVSNSTNPHRVLDYYRFVSASARRFCKMQADILRKYIKEGDFITTNGLFGNLDNHAMTAESLDFITYDSYPNFAYCLDDYRAEDLLKDRKWSRNLSESRSVSPVFGIMEQQSGANGWNTRMEAPTPRPGQLTLWTMQSIAHGADFVSYFRWRTCTVGTEIYWHGILDYSGRENRRLREVRAVAEKLSHMQELAGSRYVAKVGILKDYDNIWDAQTDKWHERVDRESQKNLFAAAQLTHTPVDFVYLTDTTTAEELARYELLFYPHASILTKERVALLEEYVSAGGQLVMGCRTGYKDPNGKCVTDCLPGLACRLTGTDIPEYTFVAPDLQKVYAEWDGERIEAAVFNDILAPAGEQAEAVASYLPAEDGQAALGAAVSPDYAGQPALIRNRFGEGTAWYFGGAFALDTALAFLRKLGAAQPFSALVSAPSTCEIAVRKKGDAQYLFVLNYDKAPASITLKTEMTDLWAQRPVSGPVKLDGYGAGVYRI